MATATGVICPDVPPDLLNVSVDLTSFTPQEAATLRLYAATPAQTASLQKLQEQAVANVRALHGLTPDDAKAVLSWGRAEAQAELYWLLADAVNAASPTDDQKNAVAWVRAVAQRQAVAAAEDAGLEYVKWAGLSQSRYQALLARDTTESGFQSDLQAFLSSPVLNYNATDPIRATGGYCMYHSPAPYESEYTGRTHPLCFASSPNPLGVQPPTPTLDQFVRWGQAVASYSLLSSEAYVNASQRQGAAAGIGLVTFAGIAAGVLAAAAVSAGTTGGIAVGFTLGATQYAAAGVSFFLPFSTSAAAVLVGAAVASVIVVFANMTLAVIAGIAVVDAAKLPGQLAQLIYDTRTTPPAASSLLSSTGSTTLFSLFVGATLPEPAPRTCDNSDQLARAGTGITITGTTGIFLISGDLCLNAPPIPPASETDPRFVVKAQGATSQTVSPTLTWRDPASGTATTARLNQTWFVTQADGKDTAQSLSFAYTDWDGKQRHAQLVVDPKAGYTFIGFAPPADTSTPLDPKTCLDDGKCFASAAIEYVGGDGQKYSASVRGPAQPTTGTPKYTTPVLEGSPVEFDPNGFAPVGAVPPVTYQWRFQGLCGIVACRVPVYVDSGTLGLPPGNPILQGFRPDYSDPVSGAKVKHTWPSSGQAQVELTATDAAGIQGTTTFTVSVANVPPALSLSPDCPAPQCVSRTADWGKAARLVGEALDPASGDGLTVFINWGDGTDLLSDLSCLVEGARECVFDDWKTDRKIGGDDAGQVLTIEASHTYAAPGVYHGTVWVTDEASADSATFTMTVQGTPQAITFPALPAQTYGGPPVALSATGGASGQPVTFAVTGDSAVCAVAAGTNGGGSASGGVGAGSATVTLLQAGPCAVTASQAGDATYAPAPPVTRTFAVQPAPLTVTANDKTVAYGGALPAFDARYGGLVNGDGAGVVSGLNCGALYADGTKPVSSGQPVGTYPITCAGGTAANYALTYLPGTLTITKAPSVVTVAATPDPAPADQPVTLTASVAVQGGSGLVHGTVEFQAGGAAIAGCAAQRVNPSGTATCTTSALGAGDHDLSASYSGDDNLFASTTTTAATLTVSNIPATRAATTLTLALLPPSTQGQAVTFTAVLAVPTPGVGTPTGTVTFSDGGTSLGTAQLAVVGGAYQATFSTSGLAVGAHAITARFSGDDAFRESTSVMRTYYVNTDLSVYPKLPSGAYNLKRSAQLTGASFVGAALVGASLTGAVLSGADFTGADLTGANLSHSSYLDGANFTSATLKNADLSASNLKGANFKGANLTGAHLSGADLSDAILSGVRGLQPELLASAVWGNTTCPDGTTSNQNGGTCLGHL
jgi:hypothetical protein